MKDKNFKKEVFDRKVKQHIEAGYTQELAEWKVLGDYNRLFSKCFGRKPNKIKTDINGNFIK